MEISFLGSIDHVMTGSGINELFDMIYAPTSVKQIMSERRYREPFVHTGLLLSKSMDVPLPCATGVEQDDAESSDKTPYTNSNLKAADSLYDELMAMTKDAEEMANDEAIAKIQAIRNGHVGHWRKTHRPVCGYNTWI